MKKKILNLTIDEEKKGVVFSSHLVGGHITHEVFEDTEDKDTIIKRLLDDSFFDNSPYKYNLIRCNEKIAKMYKLDIK